METTQPSKRKNRSKSTSSNKSPTEPAEHTETAPNLNGNKDGGSEEQETANNDKPTEETTTDENKPTQGRKRKASEMKSDSSGGEETPAEKETKEVTEPEKKVEVKVEPELSDSPTDPKKDDITMPPKQTLGKGKRARIPNKRYSDIMITSPKLEKIRKVENGEVQDNTNITEKENTIESDNSIVSSLKSTKDSLGTSRNSTSSPSGHSSKRQKFPVDLTNPNYLKPFQFGWKRELVYRATTDSTMKRNGDIYYYTPNGKKVRSMREVSENLKNKELSLDDFTFYKEPLGLDDPEKEIIRDAKVKYGSTKEHTPKTTPRVKVASPKPPPPAPTTRTPTPPATAPASETPKSTKNSAKTGGGFKVKLPNKAAAPKGKVDKKQKENEAEMEVGTYPPSWITPQTKTKTGTTKWGNNVSENEEKLQPCSIRCENVWKPIPSLQCRFCLCLYHNECVGLSPLASVEAYVCKNCQLRQQPGAATIQALLPPPPLTPISTIKSAAAAATTSSTSSSTVSVPPKLQRIPKPQDTNITNTPQIVKPLPPVPKPDLPKLTPRPGLTSVPKFIKVNNITEQNASESKSLVGSVTTWFPPSSTIQVANDQTRVNDVDAHSPPRPQFVEFLGNKKYLIVPKHNILSVSPAIASVNSKSEDFVTTPDLLNMGSDNVDEIIAEAAKIPPSPRLSAEEIKSEPHSPAHLTHPDDNLPEPMDVDTPPSIPMEIDPPDPESQKDENIEGDIAAAATIVPGENSNNVGNVTVNEVIEREDGLGENVQDTQHSLPPDLPKEEEAATANSKDLQDQEQESTGSDQERTSSRTSKLNKPKSTPTTAEDNKSINVHMDSKFMENYLQNLAYGYGTLLYVFQYLKVQDLLRAGCVCTMWRDVANHPILWRTVRMKNSQIHSFEGLADTLQKHGTVNLDLRKMLLPNGGDDLWPSFSNAINKVDSLRKIELCRCPAIVVEQLATSNPKLEVINAVTIKCESMSLNPFANVVNLQELRLKSTAGLTLTSDLMALKELKYLKHLSLTSIKDLNKLNIDVIADLGNLESLDLGECTDFPNSFGSGILTKLEKLEKLRLEKGQGTCYTFEILEAVKNMPKLEQLELVNFDIKSGFDKALGACTNIKKLLIIPTYISQSATTNHMVLGGVLRLQSTLSHFVWGVTLELLRVTELFVDQCEDSEKKEKKEKKPSGNGDSIPVLKPVPFLGELSEQAPQSTEPPQVEILPLPNLQKLLLQNLPTTRVKILKIPFHATWRQTITDTVN